MTYEMVLIQNESRLTRGPMKRYVKGISTKYEVHSGHDRKAGNRWWVAGLATDTYIVQNERNQREEGNKSKRLTWDLGTIRLIRAIIFVIADSVSSSFLFNSSISK